MATEVYVLPGFMGSKLKKVPGHGRVKEIWLNRTELALNGPDALDMAYPGPLPGPLATGPLIDAGPVDEGPYGPLLTELGRGPFIPLFWSYDWRLSIRVLASQFANTLNNVSKGKDFYVVAHSLGGLIARWAYGLWKVDNNVDRWKRTVYLGVPHGGTYTAVTALSGYAPPLSLTAMLFIALSRASKRLNNPLTPQPAVQERLNQVLASFPCLYQMLPVGTGPWAALDPDLGEVNKVANYTANNAFVRQARLDEGLTFRSDLAASLALPRPPEVCVTGGPAETPHLLDKVSELGEVGGYKWTASGDGCVPDDRATLPGVNTLQVDAGHQVIPCHASVLTRIRGLLTNGLPGNLVVADPVLPAPSLQSFIDPWQPQPVSKFPALITRGDP